jgi:hypothetical protein
MYYSCIITDVARIATAGLPKLKQLQDKKRAIKRAKVAGVQLLCLQDLRVFLLPLTAPPSIDALISTNPAGNLVMTPGSTGRLIYIPLPDTYGVEGACFTGPAQVQWIGQLTKLPKVFVVHGDTKFKLHHADWGLLTLGTHWLRWDEHHGTLSTSFAPLIYLFAKQHESVGACTLAVDALKWVAFKYFGTVLDPGATMSDHSDGFRVAFTKGFKEVPHGQCWPHIARKWREGEWCSKKWEHFSSVAEHLVDIHFANTPKMRDLLMTEYGKLWDTWGTQMNTFWNGYCIAPWDNWSIGLFDCVLCTPSQQAQESYHRQISEGRLPGLMRGSTEVVFSQALPKLVQLDGIYAPKVLNFDVPAIPNGMIHKALKYVDKQKTHVHAMKMADDSIGYYVLRLSNTGGYTKISTKLIEMYEAAADGQRDKRIKDLATLGAVCCSMMLVTVADPRFPVPKCEFNPAGLDCVHCKGFKGHGICSHVLAINHILKEVNLRRLLVRIGLKPAKLHGRKANVAPALVRQPVGEPDSSDEEAERLALLGDEGL